MHNRVFLEIYDYVGKKYATSKGDVRRQCECVALILSYTPEKSVMLKMMLLAGVGGFVGTCLRYLTGKLCHLLVVGSFPLATFVVNIIGSFIIGLLFGVAERTHTVTPAVSALLITGFCGGFTTFSSFANDMFLLLQNRNWVTLIFYAGLTLILGVVLVWAGRAVARG